MGKVEYLPAKTLTVSVTDSATNLSNYNTANNGWYSLNLHIDGSPNETSFLKSYQFDITYNNFYFYPNAATDTTKIKVGLSAYVLPNCVTSANMIYDYYVQSITPLAANKFRVKLELTPIASASVPCPTITRFSFNNVNVIPYEIRFKAVNSAINCMPSIGHVSNFVALYDNVATASDPVTTSVTNYLIQYSGTNFKTTSPLVAPCTQTIDSLTFNPRTLRAGVGDILTIKAYGHDNFGVRQFVPWFGDSTSVCNVRFRDANNANSGNTPLYVLKIDKKDIVSWKSNEIKIRIPSKYLEDASSIKGCAGSGLFEVKNGLGEVFMSKSKLHIEYSAWNHNVNGEKKRSLYINKDCKNQYKLRCHTSVTSFAARQCTWAAARHWNERLGYDVFQIDTMPIAQLDSVFCIVRRAAYTNPDDIMAALPKNYLYTSTTTNNGSFVYNKGFDIIINNIYSNTYYQYDIPTLNGTKYRYSNIAILTKEDFYAAILHEMGHGLGLFHCINENHDNAHPGLDAEIMYYKGQPLGTDSTKRVTLTTGNGHSLAGAKRILNDSKNITWIDPQYGTFGEPVSGFSLAKVASNRNICGYGNNANAQIAWVSNPPINSTRAIYEWVYNVSSPISNDTTFSGKTSNSLIIKNKLPPYTFINPSANNLVVKCNAILNSCKLVSDTFLFKASANVVLQPTPSRCMNGSVQWALPKPTPFDGTFTAYNMATPTTPITNIVDASFVMDRTKFPTAGIYKIVYNSNSTTCLIRKDSTYMSTFTNCTTLNSVAHKIYINEVCRDSTAYRNQNTAVNDPCNTMKLYFTGLGAYSVGDSLIVKLSNASGAIDTLPANINKRIIGRYRFATAVSAGVNGKSDSIQLQNISKYITTASPNYKVRLYLKRSGATPLTEWGEVYIEKINFTVSAFCSTPPPPCCSGARFGSPTFSPEEVRLYPNPTAEHFTLEIPEYEEATQVIISDAQGRIIDTRSIYSSINEIETNDLPNGMYYVKVQQGERSKILKLVIIK